MSEERRQAEVLRFALTLVVEYDIFTTLPFGASDDVLGFEACEFAYERERAIA